MDGINTVDIEGKGTMELSQGVLHLRWQPGITVSPDDAHRAMAAISTLGRGTRFPMLIEMREVTHSAAARKIWPDPSSVSRMALLGSSAVDQAMAMFLLPLLPTRGIPIKYFTSVENALARLTS